MVDAMKSEIQENVYMRVHIEQVKADALHGVSAARIAWRLRDPDGAALALGAVVKTGEAVNKKPERTTIKFVAGIKQ